ncbi:MAG: hypothetical protein ACE5H0_13085 [Bacteroidota bacterium]
MTEKEKYEPPKSGKGDIVHTIARAGLSALPVVGGSSAELFSAVVTPPLEQRRREWMEQVGETLRKLEEERGIKLEELQNNPGVIDTVMHASQAALRNSQEEKLRALRNAVLNSALPRAPEQAMQQIFIDLVDSFTEWHLRILKLFDDPHGWFELHNRQPHGLSIEALIQTAFPDLRGRRSFCDQTWRDLYTRGLVNTESIHVISIC